MVVFQSECVSGRLKKWARLKTPMSTITAEGSWKERSRKGGGGAILYHTTPFFCPDILFLAHQPFCDHDFFMNK